MLPAFFHQAIDRWNPAASSCVVVPRLQGQRIEWYDAVSSETPFAQIIRYVGIPLSEVHKMSISEYRHTKDVDQLYYGKETVAFRVSNHCSEGAREGYIHIGIVYERAIVFESEDPQIGFYGNFAYEKHKYKGLTITCRMDVSTPQPYRLELLVDCADTTFMSQDDVEEHLKTLCNIKSVLAQFIDKEGVADTLEEYALRVARALQVQVFYGQYDGDDEFKRHVGMSDLSDYLQYVIKRNMLAMGCEKHLYSPI